MFKTAILGKEQFLADPFEWGLKPQRMGNFANELLGYHAAIAWLLVKVLSKFDPFPFIPTGNLQGYFYRYNIYIYTHIWPLHPRLPRCCSLKLHGLGFAGSPDPWLLVHLLLALLLSCSLLRQSSLFPRGWDRHWTLPWTPNWILGPFVSPETGLWTWICSPPARGPSTSSAFIFILCSITSAFWFTFPWQSWEEEVKSGRVPSAWIEEFWRRRIVCWKSGWFFGKRDFTFVVG